MKSVRKMVMIPYDQYERLKSNRDEKPQVNFTPLPESTADKLLEREQDPPHDATPVTTEEMSEDVILMGLPKVYYNRAEALIGHLRRSGKVKWNNRGEIIINDKVILNSHISDLIRDAMKEYQSFNPVGKQAFYTALYESNIPTGLLYNKKRHNNFEPQYGEGSEIIPPGIPDAKPKKKMQVKTKPVKWMKL